MVSVLINGHVHKIADDRYAQIAPRLPSHGASWTPDLLDVPAGPAGPPPPVRPGLRVCSYLDTVCHWYSR